MVDSRDSKAELKAAKAYHKAQRPFYKKKRVIFPVLFVLLIVIIVIASSVGGSKSTTASTPVPLHLLRLLLLHRSHLRQHRKLRQHRRRSQLLVLLCGMASSSSLLCRLSRVWILLDLLVLERLLRVSFVLVRVNVTNTGNKSQLMDDNSQVAFDAANKEYKPNSMAGIEVNGASSLFLQEINPGNTVRRYAGVRCS